MGQYPGDVYKRQADLIGILIRGSSRVALGAVSADRFQFQVYNLIFTIQALDVIGIVIGTAQKMCIRDRQSKKGWYHCPAGSYRLCPWN